MASSTSVPFFTFENPRRKALATAERRKKEVSKAVSCSNFYKLTPLYRAVLFEKDIKVIQEHLNSGTDVNASDDDGNAPLHLAAGHDGIPEYTRALLQHGADVNITNCKGLTPLHNAMFNDKDVEIVKELLAHGAAVNMVDNGGHTPMHLVVGYGGVRTFINALVEYGTDVDVHHGLTPLQDVIVKRHVHNISVREIDERNMEVIKHLLKSGARVNVADEKGDTPLHYAVKFREVVEYTRQLLEHGADVNAANCRGFTPLHYALSDNSNLEIVEELLTHGADVNATDNEGRTPLHESPFRFRGKGMEIRRVLLGHGAVVNGVDKDGSTPLHYAVHGYGSVEYVKELLEHGANADIANRSGATPLHEAVSESSATNNLVTIKKLLTHGVCINAIDIDGRTPLHQALLKCRDAETIQELLKYGANINAIDNDGNTPLALAAKFGGMEIVRELLKHGSDVGLDYNKCNDILSIVIYRVPFAKLLIKYTLMYAPGNDYSSIFNLNPYQGSCNYNTMTSYLEDCVCEVIKMKTTMVRHGLSLHGFVTTKNTRTLLCLDNESTKLAIHQERITANYPIYSDTIIPKIRYVLARVYLLSQLKKMCVYSRNRCDSINGMGEKVVLNLDCISILAKYLSNQDLKNFGYAFNKSYRKFSCFTTPLERLSNIPESSCTKKLRKE